MVWALCYPIRSLPTSMIEWGFWTLLRWAVWTWALMGLLGGNWELTTVKHGDIIGDMFFVCFFCPIFYSFNENMMSNPWIQGLPNPIFRQTQIQVSSMKHWQSMEIWIEGFHHEICGFSLGGLRWEWSKVQSGGISQWNKMIFTIETVHAATLGHR